MRFLKCIRLGVTDLPGYGPHPGTGMAVGLCVMGGIAGIDKGGWKGFIGGFVFIAMFAVPLYLMGAYDRGNDYLTGIGK